MPHERTETVYYFDELDDDAKERARQWYRAGSFNCEWWDSTYDYCKYFLALLGFDFKPKTARIFFSGFSSYGDGACFHNVAWSAANCNPAEARKEFVISDKAVLDREGKEAQREVRRLIDDAEALTKTYPELRGWVEHRGHYQHARCTDIHVDVDGSDFEEDEDGDTIIPGQYENDYEEEFAEFARDCMRWVYYCLEREYEFLNSDYVVNENIRCNEYEFTKEGRIV